MVPRTRLAAMEAARKKKTVGRGIGRYGYLAIGSGQENQNYGRYQGRNYGSGRVYREESAM